MREQEVFIATKEGERDEQQHCRHEHNLNDDDLAQSVMENRDGQHQDAAEDELQPAGIGNAAGHFVGHQNNTEGIESGGSSIEREKRTRLSKPTAKDRVDDQCREKA